MGFGISNDDVTCRAAIIAWSGVAQREAGERRLREKMENELADAETELTRYKAKTLQNVRKVMQRSAKESDETVVATAWQAWRQCIADSKLEHFNQEQVSKIENLVSQKTKGKVENAKIVMMRMLQGQETAMVAMCFESWVQICEESKQDKELEASVKAAQEKMASISQQKKEDTKALMEKMFHNKSTDELQMVFMSWASYAMDGKKVRELEKTIGGAGGKFKSLQMSQTMCATGVQGRVNQQMELNLLFRTMIAWQTETKTHRIEKHYSNKIESKRKQLSSVQMLFQSFAQELESGLKDIDGDSSGRGDSSKRGSRKRGLSKGDPQSVSLPDIHSRKQ